MIVVISNMLSERYGWVSLVMGGAKVGRCCARWPGVSEVIMKLLTPGRHRGCRGSLGGSRACAKGRELAVWALVLACGQGAECSDQFPLGGEVWGNGHV